jgi:hypothetical protein
MSTYIKGAWYDPATWGPCAHLHLGWCKPEVYATARRHLLADAAGIRWDRHVGVNPTGARLRDTQAAMVNLRIARAEVRASSQREAT